MVVRIQFRGLNETIKFMAELPKQLDKELSKTNQEFMNSVKNDAKRLAPKDTGELRESIKLEPVRKGVNVKKWKLVVNSPHGIFQEEGFAPHSVMIINSAKLITPRRYFVSKWTPFIKPALERNFNKYLNMLKISTSRAIVNARGKNGI